MACLDNILSFCISSQQIVTYEMIIINYQLTALLETYLQKQGDDNLFYESL